MSRIFKLYQTCLHQHPYKVQAVQTGNLHKEKRYDHSIDFFLQITFSSTYGNWRLDFPGRNRKAKYKQL